jgi:pantoate--beta-alanine ligase
MIIIHRNKDLQLFAEKNPGLWQKCGFVPTMGALHEGHISLLRQAKSLSSVTVVSIFVNPSQFNDASDFERYPVTIDQDIRMLEEAGCDILFLPDVREIYPDGWQQGEHYELGSLESVLEGYYRPGHFQGVCQVVHRLLQLVLPAAIFMGQKDFQQCMVVKKLIELKSLPVQLHTCPTLRETDGLAMSSRNLRLDKDQRKIAATIYREMLNIKREIAGCPPRELEERAIGNLLREGFRKVDYVSIAHGSSLIPLEKWEPGADAVVLVAAFLGEVRLIDNLPV